MNGIAQTRQWSKTEVLEIYHQPLMDLLFQSHSIHRQHFDQNQIQISTLVSIKTGACPEDCAYCPQSARYKTKINIEKLMPVEKLLILAQRAKANGATRFCMGAAWRNLKTKDLNAIRDLIRAVKNLGLEVCMTLGMLTQEQAHALKEAGIDFYNHNLDTSPEFYPTITSTRTYQDRLDTLQYLREAEIKVCCGGIIGMGESPNDRMGLLLALANQSPHPESVPINLLARVEGTPLANVSNLDTLEFIRTIATARILMPTSYVRLSAGRHTMSDEMHAICFFAGANSIHFGEEKLFITENPSVDHDNDLLNRLGMKRLELNDLKHNRREVNLEPC